MAEKWKLTPPAVWTVTDGVLRTTKRGGSRAAAARLAADGPIRVRLRLKGTEFLKGQWCGVRIRGVHFTLRADGFWYVYNIEGKKRALGGLITSRRPRPGQWIAFDIQVRGDRFRWFADGRKLAEFREPNRIRQAEPMLVLATSGSPVAYDDVQVFALPPPGAMPSPNLLRNASFETDGDPVPPGWIPRFIPHIPPEILWRDWGVIEMPDAFHGGRALRLAGDQRRTGNGFFCANTGVAMGRPVTFSVYLKSDAPGRKATLWIWEWLGRWHKKAITVGTSWKRYSFTLAEPEKNVLRGGVRFNGPGVLYADAAQLEEGPASTPWRLSDADSAPKSTRAPSAPAIPSPIRLAVTETAPTLDGRLDEPAWTDRTRVWPLVLPGGKAPRAKTEAFMLYAKGTLYIGMVCHDPRADQVRAPPRKRDEALFDDDEIEILIDTNLDRSTYFHLAVNARGSLWDAGPGRNRTWDGEWQARTYIGKTFWSIEIALPLAALDLTALTGPRWGVNLCRHQARLGEYTSTAVPETPNFHVPDRFPVIDWGDTGYFRPFRIVPVGLELRPDGNGSWSVAGRLTNRTGSALKVRIDGTAGDGLSWRSGPVALPDGAERRFRGSALRFAPSPAGSVSVRGTIRRADTATATANSAKVLRFFQMSAPVHPLFEGRLERSVYTLEPEAVFAGVVRLPSAVRQDARVRIRLAGSRKKLLMEAPVPPGDERVRITFPIAEIAPGARPLSVELVDGRGTVRAAVACELRKVSANGPAVAVDRFRRCLLVNGEPFLVIAPLLAVWPHTPLETVDLGIDHYADNGFRSIMFVGRFREKKAAQVWERIRTQAEARGIKILIFVNGFPKVTSEMFAPFIDRWKQSPALLAWMPVDEPELYTTPEPVKETLAFFKQRDPLHPVYMNNTVMGIPSNFAGLPGDIVSIDDYLTNRPGRKVVEVVRDVAMLRRAADPGGRPVFMFLTCNQLQNHSQEPTPDVQTAQTWACVLSGASGVVYFMGDPAGKTHWRAMVRANRELQSLAGVLFSPGPRPEVRCSAPAICFTTRSSGTNRYLLAVNLEDRPVTTAFSVAGAKNADAVVLFEDRTVRIADGVLRDAFGPHQRRVYRWRGIRPD
ncbi:MAG: hypothetical protein GXP31_10440 [Kiritimatiellaeota bacterium]|nr:hypothetical protein [Kiritimatiellota bacterium]